MRRRKKKGLRNIAIRFALPLITLISLPFAFNACQGKLLGGSFAEASLGARCKAMLQNGVVTEMKIDPAQPPKPFAQSKVRLRDDIPAEAKATGAVLSKADAPLTVAKGTKLGVIIDNQCLQENRESLDSTVISKVAAATGEMLTGLDRQIYLWPLDQDYTENAIESLANNEACVVGISWNRTYKMQSFNDPNYPAQTHLTAVHADQAYSRFYAGQGTMQLTGAPVMIAVIDTGVDWTHPDLQANIWQHSQGYGIDITTIGTATVSYNPYDVSDIGHGTHVSGSIAAVSNNGVGVVGAMPYRAKIMGIKIFARDTAGNTSTTSQYFYNGVKFAYQNGANVINLSLGAITEGPASDSLAESAVNEAVQNGVTTIVVIGNEDGGGNGRLVDGTNLTSIPGMYATTQGVIGVGSFDATTGSKSYFSHYSTTYAEIGGPGAENGTTGVISTIPVSLGSYGRLEGTSQAAPIVSAAAGLTIGLIREAYGISPSPAEVERLIELSAIKSPALAPYFKDGNRLDYLNLVNQINLSYPLTGKGQTAVTLSGNCQN